MARKYKLGGEPPLAKAAAIRAHSKVASHVSSKDTFRDDEVGGGFRGRGIPAGF